MRVVAGCDRRRRRRSRPGRGWRKAQPLPSIDPIRWSNPIPGGEFAVIETVPECDRIQGIASDDPIFAGRFAQRGTRGRRRRSRAVGRRGQRAVDHRCGLVGCARDEQTDGSDGERGTKHATHGHEQDPFSARIGNTGSTTSRRRATPSPAIRWIGAGPARPSRRPSGLPPRRRTRACHDRSAYRR